MQGKVLAITEEGGVISGDDGRRYRFNASAVKADKPAKEGDEADFVVTDEGATEIYITKRAFGVEGSFADLGQSDLKTSGMIAGGGLLVAVLLSFIPVVGLFIAFVGYGFFLFGIYRISKITSEPKMFGHMLRAVLLGIAAMLVFVIFGGAAVLAAVSATIDGSDMAMTGAVVSLLVYLALQIASVWYMFGGLRQMGRVFGSKLFGVAAWVYLVGVLTVPLFGLGQVILLVYAVLMVMGLFSLRHPRGA